MTEIVGRRVRVEDPDTGEFVIGTLEGFSTVYVTASWGENGPVIVSRKDPTEPYDGAEAVHDNPRIRLDDGRVVYGCQVWWEFIEQEN